MAAADPFQFNNSIIDATSDLVCAYKPNIAFYEALGMPGLEALARTVEYIHETRPQVLVIGDTKRGDIGPSGEAYARAMFDVWQFDAVTVNAWGGHDSVAPFLEDSDRGVFVWCRGSNAGSAEFQDLTVDTHLGRLPLYQYLARSSLTWNLKGNVGLVVGATQPDQLESVRGICPGMPILIPGVGAQGGDLEAAVRAGTDHRGRLAIVNSSRGIIYASGGPDFADAARRETGLLRQRINQVLTDGGKGWLSN
jgi:orotidine-5'-phosphate decarboxylase